MGVPHPGLRNNALCSLGILAVVVGIAFGLPALDRSLPREQATASGVAYPVTDTITVVPPEGARLDVSQTRPGTGSGYAVFLVGRVRYAVFVSPDHLSLTEAADRLRTRLHDSLGAQTTGAEQPLAGIAPGGVLAGQFHAGADDGWYAVRLVGASTVVNVTASGPRGTLADRLPAIEASVASIAESA